MTWHSRGVVTFTDLAFGSSRDLETVATEVVKALEVSFERRESWYRGGDYLLSLGGHTEETISAQRNAEMDELAEPDHPDVLTLLQVEGTTRPQEIEERLKETSLTLIRRSTWDEEARRRSPDFEASPPANRFAAIGWARAVARRWRRRDT